MNKKNILKRICCILMVLCMLFSVLPYTVFAQETTVTENTTDTTQPEQDDVVTDGAQEDEEEDQEINYSAAIDVSSADDLFEALSLGEKLIRIIADFELDRTFYIASDTIIFSDEAHTLTRAADFGGDIFVVGEDESGTICENTVVFQLGRDESLTNDLLVIDGNKENMTVTVTGTVIFALSNAEIKLYDNLTVQNCFKVGNEKTYNSAYGLSYPARIGGPVAINAGGVINIYGGNYKNNSANTTYVTTEIEGEDGSITTDGLSIWGGAFYFFGKANIYGGVFEGNAAYRAGALYAYRVLSIYGGAIKNNTSTTMGGAIYVPSSTLASVYIDGENDDSEDFVEISGNTAESGGALYLYGQPSTINNAVFSGNTASSSGGAIYVNSASSGTDDIRLTVSNTTFSENSCEYNGGAVYMNNTNVFLENVTFEKSHTNAIENSSGTRYGGGAIFANGTYLDINGATFSGNSSEYHGGAIIAYDSSTAIMNNITAQDNTAGHSGGFIRVHNSTAKLYNSAIKKNSASYFGGAVNIVSSGAFESYLSTFESNTSGSHGGAIYVYPGADTTNILHSCSFVDNTSASFGGGIYIANLSVLNAYNITAKNNSAVSGGFLYETKTSTAVTLNGLTVEGNTATEGGPIIHGNTTGAVLYLNKTNYMDIDSTTALDTAYWATAIQGSLTVKEITDPLPGFINYGDTEETSPEDIVNPNVTNVIELQSALAAKLKTITIISEFQIDRTFYIDYDVTIYSSGNNVMLRRPYFGGDIFVIGESANGEIPEKEVTVTFAPVDEESSLTFDGNKDALTTTVSGTTFFVCNGATLNLKDGVSVQNSLKTGNEKTLNENYGLSYPVSIGGPVAIVSSNSTLNIYGGDYLNNSVNTQADADSTSTQGGAIYNYGNLNVYGGTFKNNTAYRGGVFYNYRKANIYNASIEENSATTNGGAIYAPASSLANLKIGTDNNEVAGSVTFKNNTAATQGGAIYGQGALIHIENAVFDSNSVSESGTNGGALRIDVSDSETANFIVRDSVFKNNTSQTYGGAMYIHSTNGLIENTTFEGNTATSEDGGAAYLTTGSNVEFISAKFNNNSAGTCGGAVSARSSSIATIYNAKVTNNSSNSRGGSLYASSATLYVYNSHFSDNKSNTSGGAIAFSDNSTGGIYETEFVSNTSGSEGGALFIYTAGYKVVVQNCVFESNIGGTNGGAIYAANKSLLDLYNVTAKNNSADKGGFLYETKTGTLVILNGVTLSGNTATSGGPIIWGNTKYCDLHINKNNYTDLDHTGAYDSTYWAAAIYNSITVTEITDEIPSFDGYGDETYDDIDKAVKVSDSKELEEAINNGEKHIQIVSDFDIDRTFYITNDTTIFALTPYRLTRATDFAGDIFVVGEYANGDFTITKNKTVKLTLGIPNSTTENLLIIDGNCNNMTVDVVGSVIFSCSSSTINIYNNTTITDATKVANARVLDEAKYALSSNTLIGGAAILVESGTLNIYGGNFINNNALGYNGGAICSAGNVKIYGGKFAFNKGTRGGVAYSTRLFKIYGGNFMNNYAGISGGAVYTANSETGITHIGANTGTTTVFFNGNKSAKTGGALYAAAKGTLIIYGDTEFDSNSSQKSNGGAIYAGGVLLLSNITFKNNQAKSNGGAIYCSNSNSALPIRYLKFENCIFDSNTASNGGAIYATSKANITLKNITFTENTSTTEGGAIYAAYESEIEISDSTFTGNISLGDTKGYGGAIAIHSSCLFTDNVNFSNNSSKRGGAVYVSYNSALEIDSTAVVNNSIFTNNDSTGNGGAIYVISRSYNGKTDYELTVKGSQFTENIAEVKGGAVYLSGNASTYYEDVTFSKNQTIGTDNNNQGGAIYSTGATIKINKASFTESLAGSGGGAIYLTGSTLDANEVTFENNTSTLEGGAISVRGSSTAVINNATLTGNKSGTRGGAAYVSASLTVYNSNFSNNTSSAAGGAIAYVDGGSGGIYKTDFTNNTSSSEGGALFVYTGGKSVVIHNCNFEGNISQTNGGVFYASNKSLLDLYNTTAKNNSANKGGAFYITTTGTTVILSGVTLSGNTATTGGPIIWGNSTGAKLNIDKSNYTDLDHTGDYDDAYWASAIYNLLTVNEIADEIPTYTDYVVTYPEVEETTAKYFDVNVDAVFDLTKSSSDANISSNYNKLTKLDNSSNFMSKNTALFENINGENVTVDSFVSYTGDTAGNGNFGEGMLILQALQYKKAHPEEDVKISISSFRFSVQAAINVNRNGRYFGYMRNLSGGAQYDKYGFVRISYLLLCAASMGIDVTVVGQLDGYPITSSEPNLYQYFSSMLGAPCNTEYVENGVIGDYLTFGYCDWKSYEAKGATDMMHTKMCAVSHYLDKDGVAHKNAVWTSSSNLDGVNSTATNGNNKLQTSTIVSNHAELYRVASNYIDLVSQYCGQEDVYAFRELAIKRATEQIDLLLQERGSEIPLDEQIVYIGTENDDVFELYFAPFGGGALEWSDKYNPYCKYISALNQSEDYIEFSWNNVKFGKNAITNHLEDIIINAFNTNKNPNNKLYINLPGFAQDSFKDLEVGKDIGYMSFNTLDFGSIHSKDLQLSYVQNGERKYVSMLNSLNIHSGSMCYQSNFMLVIKETQCTEDSVYFTIADLTTKGIVEHNYGEKQTYLPETNEDGYHYKVCKDCGKTAILDVAHRESEWIVDKAATETKKGLEHKECTACGQLLFVREASFSSADIYDLSQNSGITFDSNPSLLVPIEVEDIPYTFEATVQVPKNLNSRAGVILGNYGNSSNTQLNLEVYTHGKIRLFLMVGKQKTEHIFSTDIRSDSPKNIAVTIDGTKASLYINGEFSETATLDFAYSELLKDLKIGGDNRSGNPQYFKGEIYSVNLFSDVRTAQEVKTDAIYVSEDLDALTYSKYFTANEERFECKPLSSVGQTFSETVAHSVDTLEESPATIEAIVSIPKNHADSAGVILGNYGDLYDSHLNIEVVEEGRLKLYVANGENISELTFSTDVRSDTAVHLAVTVDGKEASLYVNGNLTETQDFSDTIPSTLEGLKIGGDNRNGNSQYFKGTIYSVALFSDIRTIDEIASDMIVVSSDSDNLLYLTRFWGGEKATNTDKPIGQTFSAEEILAIDELSSTPYTLEATVNVPKSITSRAGVIVGNYDTGVSNKLNFEITTNGNPRLYINNGTTTYTFVFNTDIRSDDPVHIALTINKRIATLYVNGEKVEDKYLSQLLPVITQNFKIGGDNREGNAQYFKGTIYNVALFSDVRTEQEIKSDALAIDDNADNLILSKDLTKKEVYSSFVPVGKTFSSTYSHSLGNLSCAPATLEAVVNLPTDIEDRAGTIVGNYDGGNSAQMNLEVYSKGRVRLHVNNGTERFSTFFSSDIRSNYATHIAVTIENKLATLYINGVAKEKRTLSISLPQATENFVIGGDNRVGNTEYFKGTIYSVSLFSDIRTPQEIKSDMLAVCASEENLIYTGTFANTNIATSTDGAIFSEDKILAIDELSSTPYTLEATVNVPKSITSRAGVIIGNYDTGVSNKLNLEVTTNGKPRLYINNGTTTYTYVFNTDIRSDDPVHIALTINKKIVTLYVNGEKVESQYLSRVLPVITQNFKIGGDNREGNAQYFKGTIYNVALFGDVRTAKEIKADAVAIDNNADSLLYSKCFTHNTCHLAANGEHISGEWIIDSNATTTQKGAKHTACTACGKVLSVGIINTSSSEDILIDYSSNTGVSFETNEDAIAITEALSSAPTTFEVTLNLPTSYSARGGVLLGNYTGTIVDQINLEIYTHGKPRLYFKKNNKAYTYLFKTDVRSDKLTHLALVIDGLTANLYINGELKETITLDTTLPDVRSGYKIGADNRTSTPQPFKGTIYAVNIFSDVRTAEEIVNDTLLVPSDTDNLIYSNYLTKK